MDERFKAVPKTKVERNEDQWELSKSNASSSEKIEKKIELSEDDYNEFKN